MAERFWALGSLLGLALSVSCASEAPPPSVPPALPSTTASATPPPVVLSIVGTNDVHGELERIAVFSGYLKRLRQARQRDGAVLLLDAGDMFQGTLESNLVEGASVIDVMNTLSYTAATIGNHDFDYGPVGDRDPKAPGVDPQGALRARLSQAKFPFLSSNLTNDAGKLPDWSNLSPSTMIDVRGVKVGLIGALTEETPNIVLASYFQGLRVTSIARRASEEARRLRARGARVVILLAHAGGKCSAFDDPGNLSVCSEEEILRDARAIPEGLVDVIIGGHTHQAMAHFVGSIAVANSWARGRAFSRVDVSVPRAPDAPLAVHIFPPLEMCGAETSPCDRASYEGGSVSPDPAATAVIAPFLARAEAEKERPLGVRVEETLAPEHDHESALGNLVADWILASAKDADVAVMNAGGLRGALPAGALTYGELYGVTPFDNQLARVRLTAGAFADRVRQHLQQPLHGIIAVSGLRVDARCKNGKLDVQLIRKNGRHVRPEERIVIATSDFLATGGDELFPAGELPAGSVEISEPPNLRDRIAVQLSTAGGTIQGPKVFDPQHPRLALPAARPIHCN